MTEDTKSTPIAPTKETPATPKPSAEFLEALSEEMLLTAATLGASLDELAILGYLEALSGKRIDLLRAAFKKLRKEYAFHTMPLPAEIIEASHLELERIERERPVLPQGDAPEWSADDRKTWANLMNEHREKLNIPKPIPVFSKEESDKRMQILREQAALLLGKPPEGAA